MCNRMRAALLAVLIMVILAGAWMTSLLSVAAGIAFLALLLSPILLALAIKWVKDRA